MADLTGKLFAHRFDDTGLIKPEMYFDDEATFRRLHPGWRLDPWDWRLPDAVLDAHTLPGYGGQFKFAKLYTPAGDVWGWLIDPDATPPDDLVAEHNARCAEAARRALQFLGE